MKIFFIAADTGGSAWYRVVLPSDALTWRGHTVGRALGGIAEDWMDSDAVVGARVATYQSSMLWRRLKDRGARLVCDIDDDYFHLGPDNPGFLGWDTLMLESLSKNMALSDVVTVPCEALAELAREHTDNVVVIPNGLPAQFLAPVKDYDPERLTVGWSGSGATMHELPIAARAIRRIADYSPRVDVRVVGISPEQASAQRLAHPRARASGYIANQGEYQRVVSQFDIWVAPYRDMPFNRAKFATKALEASFHGIPLIVSDIRPYREWIEHGVNGFLAKEHEFGKYLTLLVNEPELRQKVGLAARAKGSQFIIQTLNQQWEQVLEA